MIPFVIGDRVINEDSEAYVIAEAGCNHGGDVNVAHAMVDAAAEAGASAFKLQKRSNRKMMTKAMFDAPYNSEAALAPTYGAHREKLELNYEDYVSLSNRIFAHGLDFIATAFDPDALDFLVDVGVDAIKIASGDAINDPLLDLAKKTRLPIIVSLGGLNYADVLHLVDFMHDYNWCPLHCTASYPVRANEMNLSFLTQLSAMTGRIVGLSDHFSGTMPGPAAYALGARIFEKHMTLSRTMKGTDHAFSMEPHGLEEFISHLHDARLALGDGQKRPFPSEEAPLRKMRKKIVAARPLSSGVTLTAEDMAVKSPGDGLSPREWWNTIGKYLTEPLDEDENIENGWRE